MLTLSNSLSFIRAPLAFVFLHQSPTWRLIAIILAMITDSIDGYLARRNRSASRFGAILDPAMDKFFVFFGLSIFFFEGKLSAWEIAAMLSRDFFQCIFALLSVIRGRWKTLAFRAVRWGKATTAMQFLILIGIVLNFTFPWFTFLAFVIMGWLAFLEHFRAPERTSPA